MKIELASLFTPYSIDTYQLFTFEDGINCDDYVEALATNLERLLNDNILDNVILKVEKKGKSWSPKEYNYSTDSCSLVFSINEKKLNDFIKKNKEDYEKNKIDSCDGFCWLGDTKQTQLHYYLKKKSAKNYDVYNYIVDQRDDTNIQDFLTKI